jgi:hypothetical protein
MAVTAGWVLYGIDASQSGRFFSIFLISPHGPGFILSGQGGLFPIRPAKVKVNGKSVAAGAAYRYGMSIRPKFADRNGLCKMTFRTFDDSCIIGLDKGSLSIACSHRLWLVADFKWSFMKSWNQS